jgi:hypothetical protein
MLTLAELTFERITLEVRYETAFLFWDNSGKALAAVAHDYPKIQIRNANISNVLCDWMAEGLTFYFDNTKAYVIQDYPQKLALFHEFTGCLINQVRDYLKVQNYTRVGCRHIHSLSTKSGEEANGLMRTAKAWPVEDERLKPFGTQVTECMIRIEDDDRGSTLHISKMPRKITLEVTRPFVLETSGFDPDAIVIDVDAYTKKIVAAPELDVRDFVTATIKNTDQNLFKFLGW